MTTLPFYHKVALHASVAPMDAFRATGAPSLPVRDVFDQYMAMKPSEGFAATARFGGDPTQCAASGGAADDGNALAGAQAGDEAAFAKLIRAHQRPVYGLALRALGNSAEAEDLAQEVFLQLLLSLDRIESCEHLAHWLRRAVTHRVIDRFRQRRRMPQVVDIAEWEAGSSDVASMEAEPEPLERLVAQLPAIPRLVVALRYQEDLDPAEIAQLLDMSVNTVKSHLKRSLARLRAACDGGRAS
jgi:RNA polymerase sigma-70 factor, ECF subfamily